MSFFIPHIHSRDRCCAARKLEHLDYGHCSYICTERYGRGFKLHVSYTRLPVATDRHGEFSGVLHALVDERVTHTFQGDWRFGGLAHLRR